MFERVSQTGGTMPAASLPSIPTGRRIYAVGDIHGRADLFEAIIAAIEEDDAAAQCAISTVILLGDLVDRGSDSAAVIALARAWARQREVRIIAGNHEEMFLQSFHETDVLRYFLRYGGRETLLSYGIEAGRPMTDKELKAVQAVMEAQIPEEDLLFVSAFEDLIEIGDYAFVHAGIRPDLGLKDQSQQDLRWIREPFLSHEGALSHVVVHGHTIDKTVQFHPHRIGIDTGAFKSGRLTALVLEGTGRRLIQTHAAGDAVRVSAGKVEL